MKVPHSCSSSSFRSSDHSPDPVIPATRHSGMPRSMHLIYPCEVFYMRRTNVEKVPRARLQHLELALPFSTVTSGRFAHGSAPASWCSETVLPSRQMLSVMGCAKARTVPDTWKPKTGHGLFHTQRRGSPGASDSRVESSRRL